LEKCNGEIRFRDVEFSYDGRKQALRGLDFIAKPGTTTAFVGESGGGKTTVLRLLFRFYAVQAGAIEVDGQNVEDITLNSLREHIGVVPQDTVLFNETVMYNLKYANQNATDEMVYDACRAASIHDKIMSFPDGYKTRVGERGLRLSGGEKQRVAIARTILKNPKIILLDEATAALDSETEQHIQAALKELSRGRTMLVIAHRLSTIVGATQILCMHQGRVAEAGTHEELLAMNGRYKNMWNKQIRAEKVEKAKARLEESPDTPVISSSSSSVSDEQLDGAIPTGQNTAGANPTSEPTEITPDRRDAEDVDPGNAVFESGSLKRSASNASIDKGKWSATGLRKALGRSDKGGPSES
jgi:ABC-type transport system involved in cytochrome bd biosynthesis fused ATPase/permease subunit